ncbi:MAG TPA: hypothetical protein VIC05_02315 [Solirubrobacteraceae bacterium]
MSCEGFGVREIRIGGFRSARSVPTTLLRVRVTNSSIDVFDRQTTSEPKPPSRTSRTLVADGFANSSGPATSNPCASTDLVTEAIQRPSGDHA